ncbi:MAG TPA: hypothetical protein ENI82_01585 [Bacteroidetes bacterium]|nr:hypothetical protein [Bacteroidota bacterium]
MIIIQSKILVKFITLNFAQAITLFPFILLKDKKLRNNEILINHEKIHIRQQLELLIIPFYLIYLSEFLIKYLKYKSRYKAYRNISFEKEAFENESDKKYLKSRNWFQFIKYL